MARLVLVVSFLDEDDYEYVKNQPNSSHYIRELVKNDRKNKENDKSYIDKRIAELKKELMNTKDLSPTIDNEDDFVKEKAKSMIDFYS